MKFSTQCTSEGTNKMPVHKTKGGGYQWGNSGKIYYGKGAKEKSQKQGVAIKISQENEKGKKS